MVDTLENIVWSKVYTNDNRNCNPVYWETEFRNHHFVVGALCETFVMTEVDYDDCHPYIHALADNSALCVRATINGEYIDMPPQSSIEKMNEWLVNYPELKLRGFPGYRDREQH
jgi:hypothetical protein